MSVLQTESQTAIVQRALGLAEQGNRFDSLEDDSAEAREGRLRYDMRRRFVLEAIDWNFARRRMNPAQVETDATPHDQPYAFPIPARSLRIRNVQVSGCNVSWSRDHVIFAAQPRVQIVYTIDETNPVLFAPVFTSALEFLLAADFSMIFARSVNRAQTMLGEYRNAMEAADSLEGQERSNDSAYEMGDWVDSIAGLNVAGQIW